ncbi:unnamed protein product [Bemisia tabaci]|uniref:Vesicle transport protein USE1 n=1 Tax=Bemisia tabaci TaxID=7038 RepID=A0A9P0AMQ7_BEMTA|nr:unnamed protein product [Bemisia tabaci]
MTASFSRLDIDVRRLLARCEEMAREQNSEETWRLEKFIGTLEEMVEELEKLNQDASNNNIFLYKRRIEFLRGLLKTQKIENPFEKVMAAQLLSSNLPNSLTKEIHQKTTAKFSGEIRDELFDLQGSSLRFRDVQQANIYESLDDSIKSQQSKQAHIAEEMLIMTRNMKELSRLAGDTIRKDVRTFENSSVLADSNFSKLKVEAEKLELLNKGAWKCWMWLIIVLVLFIFVFMVIFMKVNKKKK